jgi:hypothetical protein
VETFYQGANDVFLEGVRAEFDAVEEQSERSVEALRINGLLESETTPLGIFTDVNAENEAVWRYITTTGVQSLQTRSAGGTYPEGKFIRGYETDVFDPDLQDAIQIIVPEERQEKEAPEYKMALNRAQKELNEIHRKNIADPMDVFNYGFTAPSSYANGHFVAKGDQGLDGNLTALGERLISTVHARADAGTTLSNAVNVSGNSATFSDTNYYAGLELAQGVKDDVGKPMPMLSGTKCILVPPATGLVRTAKELNISEWKVGTTNNEENVNKGTFTDIISSPYLLASYNSPTITSTTQWFVVDTSTRERQVGTGLVRVTFVPTDSRVERLLPNDAIVYKVKQSYSYVWVDWRNVIGSNGLGTAYSS